MNQDESEIRQALTEFAVATENADIPRMRELLCPDEAADFDDYEYEYDPEQLAVPIPVDTVEMTITDIVVRGDHGSALVTRNDVAGPQSLALAKIDGSWKVCIEAEEHLTGSA